MAFCAPLLSTLLWLGATDLSAFSTYDTSTVRPINLGLNANGMLIAGGALSYGFQGGIEFSYRFGFWRQRLGISAEQQVGGVWGSRNFGLETWRTSALWFSLPVMANFYQPLRMDDFLRLRLGPALEILRVSSDGSLGGEFRDVSVGAGLLASVGYVVSTHKRLLRIEAVYHLFPYAVIGERFLANSIQLQVGYAFVL